MTERSGEKFPERRLKLGFASRLDLPGDGDMDGFVHKNPSSKKKTQGRGDIVDVAAAGVVNIAAGKKVDVGRAKRHVPLDLPLQIHIHCGGDIGRTAVRRDFNKAGWCVDRIVLRVAPEHIRSAVDGKGPRQISRKIGMNINDVRRTNQAGIIEITGLEIERIESSLMAVAVVAARDIHF